MLKKTSSIAIVLSYLAYLPYLLLLICGIYGTPIALSIFVWGGIFYTGIVIAAKSNSQSMYIIDMIQIGLFLLCRILVQSLQLNELEIMLDFSITSWLCLLMIHKFLPKKELPSSIYIIIACVFPYVFLLLFVPQALIYAKTPGLPLLTGIDFLSFENLLIFLSGPIITIGLLCMDHIKQITLVFALTIFHIIMMFSSLDMIDLFNPMHNAEFFLHFAPYRIFIIGCLLSTILYKIYHKVCKLS